MSSNKFIHRHIGPGEIEKSEMLKAIGVSSLEELIDQTIPPTIRLEKNLNISEAMTEYEYLSYIRDIGKKNKLFKSYIGQGFYNTISLAVIRRNILENPAWYTSYTPYQAEIAQGRLEALLNFQTMVTGLTGMELANASLLDESTAAAEAMIMMFNLRSRAAIKEGVNKFFIDENVFPQTFSVMETRAIPLGIELVTANYESFQTDGKFFGCLFQYPDSVGEVRDYREFVDRMHKSEILVGVAADLLSLALLVPPGEWDADIVVGSTQRFGIPLGYGGPHAAYFATREKFKRNIPGRIIGVSVDRHGNQALRMALQTREQHIKREKATSNICTAQALLASMAGMYGVYHGPEGIKSIASRIHLLTRALAEIVSDLGYEVINSNYFDTLKIKLPSNISMDELRLKALESEINFLMYQDGSFGISLDETVNIKELNRILEVFAQVSKRSCQAIHVLEGSFSLESKFLRDSDYMKEKVFNTYHSETELMRYIKKLERKDLSLTHSMISLGSCTMKLNAAAELFAFLWPEFADIHPFVPIDQVEGYQYLFNELGMDLCEVTGFEAISFQPNSGAAGEYAGLMVIRAYHNSRNESHRNVVLIPASAHGTNPASAVMAGMEVVVVDCDENGNIDTDHLEKLAREHSENLAGFMITYPSTHGVFEEQIREMIDIVHKNGGQVYMDGANMNAQVGLTNPGIIGADVCHLNLHKTFAIPHGGGGPGVGPIAVAGHLVEFLPEHPLVVTGGVNGITAIAAAPYGSASILTISHAYIKMLGPDGLRESTKMAILNANYLAAKLKKFYNILYKGKKGRVGHEMILDCRNFKPYAGISEADIAKRLMDYGFHAPTLSFPVHGTLMVEPTESESKAELDRFIESMISIYHEISEIHEGDMEIENNPLKNAPHTAEECIEDIWEHPYSRNKAAYPLDWIRENKFWPAVGRVDDAYGDRNLMCTCAPLEAYKS
jgi:glycine dehydrogenase